jgi:hypothetical protein
MTGPRAFIPQWVAGVKELGGLARVYLAIASHADKAGLAYPSLARIAGLTQIDRRNIPALVAAVERAGLIRKEGIGRRGHATLYRVCQAAPGDMPRHAESDIPHHDRVSLNAAPGDMKSGLVVTSNSSPGDMKYGSEVTYPAMPQQVREQKEEQVEEQKEEQGDKRRLSEPTGRAPAAAREASLSPTWPTSMLGTPDQPASGHPNQPANSLQCQPGEVSAREALDENAAPRPCDWCERVGADQCPEHGNAPHAVALRAELARRPSYRAEWSFERYKGAYPKRGDLGDDWPAAAQIFNAAVEAGEDPYEIILAAENYARAVNASGIESRYVQLAKNWLAKKPWHDDPDFIM